MRRRDLAALLAAPAFAQSSRKGLSLNEDANHFFVARRKKRLTRDLIADWVTQYQNTQVRELILNVNAMRSSFASKHREAWWTGFDPKGGPNQAFLAPLPDAARQVWFEWIGCAWQMDQDGLDLYSIWIPEARKRGMSPWISVRMNDLHEVDNEKHPMHSGFWRDHPQFRRVPYRGEQRDKALDYARPEVRAYYFRYLEEVCERYDFDTLELDWMRHGFHFRPGYEDEGQRFLNEFHRETRRLLDGWQKKRKHPIELAVRVPSSPRTARRLGMDPADWPVDFVTATNYWRTVDTAMPMEEWRRLLPRKTKLAAGLELGLNSFPGSVAAGGKAWQSNSLETVRGAATGYLRQGVDRIYLFNYMDADTTLDDFSGYAPLLRECGELSTTAGKTRRHVVTYQDTWAPGETPWSALPAEIPAGRWRAFRIETGPMDAKLKPVVWLTAKANVRFNGEPCTLAGEPKDRKPGPHTPCYGFDVPAGAWKGGEAVVEASSDTPIRLEWVEVELRA